MRRDVALSQLWESLIDVERCFQNVFVAQMQESNSFVGECVAPIKDAYLSFKTAESKVHHSIKTAEPFLSLDTVALAESALNTAVTEFNALLNLSRRAMVLPDREKARRVLVNKRRRSLAIFRRSLLPLIQCLPESIKNERIDNIWTMERAPVEPTVSARRANSAALNVTLADLIRAIDESDGSVAEKNDLKRAIDDLVCAPLVTAILTRVGTMPHC